MKQLKYFFGIILILAVFILLFSNYEAFSTKVTFQIKIFRLQYVSPALSYYSIIGTTFVFGLLVGGLYGIFERYQLRTQIKKMKIASREQEKELNSLRNLPITSDNVGAGNYEVISED